MFSTILEGRSSYQSPDRVCSSPNMEGRYPFETSADVASSSNQPIEVVSLPSLPSFSNFSQRSFGNDGLPPLPRIGDRRLLAQIFTHRSLARRPKRSFEDSPDDPSPDNEQLVHIGDPVFSLVVTDLIRDLFPHLSVVPSSKVRDRLKHTSTLARVAVLYRLHERLQVPSAQANVIKASQNAQAEVFKVSLSLLLLFDTGVEKNYYAQAYVGGLYREQGMGPVTEWLRLLFQLYIRDAYQNMRTHSENLLLPVQPPAAEPPPAARRIL
ncbi:hypothetical protein V8E53_007547 [Lactarius tabidus]